MLALSIVVVSRSGDFSTRIIVVAGEGGISMQTLDLEDIGGGDGNSYLYDVWVGRHGLGGGERRQG